MSGLTPAGNGYDGSRLIFRRGGRGVEVNRFRGRSGVCGVAVRSIAPKLKIA